MILDRISLWNLFGISGILGILGAGSGLLYVRSERKKVLEQPYYQQGTQTFRRNLKAIELIGGEPVQFGRIDFSERFNQFNADSVQLMVPVKGKLKTGQLMIFAEKDPTNSESDLNENSANWQLRRLEMTLDDIKDKKVIVFKEN